MIFGIDLSDVQLFIRVLGYFSAFLLAVVVWLYVKQHKLQVSLDFHERRVKILESDEARLVQANADLRGALTDALSFADLVFGRVVLPKIYQMVKAKMKGNEPVVQAKDVVEVLAYFQLIYGSKYYEPIFSKTRLYGGFYTTVEDARRHYAGKYDGLSEQKDFGFSLNLSQSPAHDFPKTVSAILSWNGLEHPITAIARPNMVNVVSA